VAIYKEEDDQSGVEIDLFDNRISWGYSDNDGLITFYIKGEEITCWSIEIEPELAVSDFMKTWNLAQKSVPLK